MSIRVRQFQLYLHNIQTRMPFRYGIAEMTAVPHLILKVDCEIDGEMVTGFSADSLIPKWFTKDPETAYRDDLADMLAVIKQAGAFAHQAGEAVSAFALWREVYRLQEAWAGEKGYPSLLWNFGVSLVERAVIDALCRVKEVSFAEAVDSNLLGIQLGEIHPELAGSRPGEWLPDEPLDVIDIRHTVGLGDYLADEDIPLDERLDDGLPQSLEANITHYGLRYFKIKIKGDVDQDSDRLCQIDQLLKKHGVEDYRFTLDGNEQYKTVSEFRRFWEKITSDSGCSPHMAQLLFVEQPFHRTVALNERTRKDLLAWEGRPLMIIDESDSEIGSMRTALESGYAGTSHKNCKGVFKSIANACLLEYLRQQNGGRQYVLSGEDLANVGPAALLQDLAVMAALGITHVERNGHHYFAGLSMFPESVQQHVLFQHPALYHKEGSYAALKISHGRIEVKSLHQVGLGHLGALEADDWFQPLEQWHFDSLQI